MSDNEIRVGLCGFSMAQAGYPRRFPVVEIQHTFYQPPALAVLDRWRRTMPAGFEFTIKAWQLITHTAASPTYRRLRRVLTEDERAGAGSFRDSEIVAEAWRVTCECAARVRATAILFQCPARFTPTPPHLAELRSFFARIDRPAGAGARGSSYRGSGARTEVSLSRTGARTEVSYGALVPRLVCRGSSYRG